MLWVPLFIFKEKTHETCYLGLNDGLNLLNIDSNNNRDDFCP